MARRKAEREFGIGIDNLGERRLARVEGGKMELMVIAVYGQRIRIGAIRATESALC